MPSLPPIRSFNLKIIFLVHFIFVALSCMGSWSTSSFLFYNLVLVLLLIWSIYHSENEEPVQLAIVVNGISVILDILLLIFNYPSYQSASAGEKFSAAMCILHLLVRPFSIILLIKNLEERSGSSGALTGLFPAREQQSSYEDIDRSTPQTSQGPGYGFSSAQQI